jgi:hypothetical protein
MTINASPDAIALAAASHPWDFACLTFAFAVMREPPIGACACCDRLCAPDLRSIDPDRYRVNPTLGLAISSPLGSSRRFRREHSFPRSFGEVLRKSLISP